MAGKERGEVLRWIGRGGFGFVRDEKTGEEVFCHASSFGGGDLIIGEQVFYNIGTEKGRTVCLDVEGPGVNADGGKGRKGGRPGGDGRDRGFDRRDDHGYDRRGDDRGFERRDRGYDRHDDRDFDRRDDRGYDRRDRRYGDDRGFDRRDDRGYDRRDDRRRDGSAFDRRDDRGYDVRDVRSTGDRRERY